MAQNVRALLTDHSSLDGTGDAINGAEIDFNSFKLADVLDGTTDTQMNDQGGLSFTKVEIGTKTQLVHSTAAMTIDSAVAAGSVTATEMNLYGGQITGLGDDAVSSLWSSGPEGQFMLLLGIQRTTSNDTAGALYTIQTTSSPSAVIIGQGGGFTLSATTADVAGTTGTDGQFTLSARQGIIELENRSGNSCNVKWVIFG